MELTLTSWSCPIPAPSIHTDPECASSSESVARIASVESYSVYTYAVKGSTIVGDHPIGQ